MVIKIHHRDAEDTEKWFLIYLNAHRALFSVVLLAVFSSGCFFSSSESGSSSSAASYIVSVPYPGSQYIHMQMTIPAWPHGGSVRLALPPVYADNPLIREPGHSISNLWVSDANGLPVAITYGSVQMGPDSCAVITFGTSNLPAVAYYDISFNYPDTLKIPAPYTGQQDGYLQGNYIFIIPLINEELATLWRTPYPVDIIYNMGPGIDVYGVPAPKSYCRNLYELMFTNFTLGGRLQAQGSGVVQGPLTGQEFGTGQEWDVVSLRQGPQISGGLSSVMISELDSINSDIFSNFPVLGHTLTAILGINRSGGLEGMWAFSIIDPPQPDTLGIFNLIYAHEALHCWVGVRVGDMEDPWWKEGTTSYLACLITKRNELCSQLFLDNELLKDLSPLSIVMNVSLSAPQVRDSVFNGNKEWYTLVYKKGARVNMLLDKEIRIKSQGSKDLAGVLGQFCALYNGRAFTRQEYLDFLLESGGADVSGIFDRFVDLPGVIPPDTLAAAYTWLGQNGAFGRFSPIPLAKLAEYDLPDLRW